MLKKMGMLVGCSSARVYRGMSAACYRISARLAPSSFRHATVAVLLLFNGAVVNGMLDLFHELHGTVGRTSLQIISAPFSPILVVVEIVFKQDPRLGGRRFSAARPIGSLFRIPLEHVVCFVMYYRH
jgi:hypothetical protein